MLKYFPLFLFSLLTLVNINARELPKSATLNPAPKKATTLRADCKLATASVDLAVNNVRAQLRNGGDMWWDGREGGYIVPRVDPSSGKEEVSSFFAGAIWMGGIDPAANLKLAGQTYGSSSGNTDYWPGPLTETGSTDEQTCEDWDRFFNVTHTEVRETQTLFEAAQQGGTFEEADIPSGVKGWPARGNPYFTSVHGFSLPNTLQGLAPFWDNGGDGLYDPLQGDYPILDVKDCDAPIVPDEMIFWIFNDAGGIHTETGGDAIQMEVQNIAYAYASNDPINNSTFYYHKLVNRAIEPIDSFYFGYWVDADLGCAEDDYFGCDTLRDFVYIYNQDNLDGGPGCENTPTYSDQIPALGIDLIRGLFDSNELTERGLDKFIYYNNNMFTPPGTASPGTAIEFYRYLTGSWRDGIPLTSWGTGYNLGSTEFVDYAFTGYPNDGFDWSMCSEALAASDRRFVMSSGGIRLDPGAVNEIITSVVWTPELEYPCPDLALLLEADDIAQALFDNCFNLLDGPDAPDLIWEEQDRELKVSLVNNSSSNNYEEEYQEVDFRAPSNVPVDEATYRFEGYRLYQLEDGNVNALELNEPSKARLIATVDIANGIDQIINWAPPVSGQGTNWVGTIMNSGAQDDGLIREFTITEDLFATGNTELENGKVYYIMAVAYAYNNYEDFSQTNGMISGQAEPYLQGRRNVRVYRVSPKKINPVGSTTDVEVMRLDGMGANGNFLQLVEGEREKMIDGSFDGTITYEGGYAPVDVFVKDPDRVKNKEYLVRFYEDDVDPNQYRYKVFQPGETDTLFSDQAIGRYYEQTTPFGFNLGIGQTNHPGNSNDDIRCGTIGAIIDTEGTTWLDGVADEDQGVFDYIKTETQDINADNCREQFSKLGQGNFVPFSFTDHEVSIFNNLIVTPALTDEVFEIVKDRSPVDSFNNVDIVFTPDKSKWSRCIVVETASELYYGGTGVGQGFPTIGDAENFYLRKSRSVTTEALPGTDFEAVPESDPSDIGMGWFPGYAVDVETGERLNIFFGENSVYGGQTAPQAFSRITGDNMIWDPTSERTINSGEGELFDSYMGGQHFIYVTKTAYDGCESFRERIDDIPFRKIRVLQQVTWVGMPLLASGQELLSYEEGLIPAETLVQLRVQSPYRNKFGTGQNQSKPEYMIRLGEDVVSALHTPVSKAERKIYPNPYHVQFHDGVLSISGVEQDSRLSLYDINGKLLTLIKHKELMQPGNEFNWNIPPTVLSNLSAGVYFIRIQDPDGREQTVKWVVMQ